VPPKEAVRSGCTNIPRSRKSNRKIWRAILARRTQQESWSNRQGDRLARDRLARSILATARPAFLLHLARHDMGRVVNARLTIKIKLNLASNSIFRIVR
jgi:hypothetical protein